MVHACRGVGRGDGGIKRQAMGPSQRKMWCLNGLAVRGRLGYKQQWPRVGANPELGADGAIILSLMCFLPLFPAGGLYHWLSHRGDKVDRCRGPMSWYLLKIGLHISFNAPRVWPENYVPDVFYCRLFCVLIADCSFKPRVDVISIRRSVTSVRRCVRAQIWLYRGRGRIE